MAGIKRKSLFCKLNNTGYETTSVILASFINYSATFVLFILALPFFVILPILIKLEDDGPVFYHGLRLGKDKKPFYMYKFRTLVPNAEEIIGSQLVTAKHQLETRLGYYLRETRIDEIPQLLNVLKGDMNLIGPRPERAVIYEEICKNISDYDYRFKVKPGIIGHSQLITPHNTPKRIRVLIDNHHIRQKQFLLADFFFIFIAVLILIKKGIMITGKFLLRILTLLRIRHSCSGNRSYARIKTYTTQVMILPESDSHFESSIIMPLEDINDESLAFNLPYPLVENKKLRIKLLIEARVGQFIKTTKHKVVYCTAEVFKIRHSTTEAVPQYRHILKYSPDSDLNFYRLHKYLLNKSIL